MGAWRTVLNESGGVEDQQWKHTGSPRWPSLVFTGKGPMIGRMLFLGWGRSALQSQRQAEKLRLTRMN